MPRQPRIRRKPNEPLADAPLEDIEHEELSGLDDLTQPEKRDRDLLVFEGLPHGFTVECQTQEELELCRTAAHPYLVNVDGVPREDWIHVKHYLEAILMRGRVVSEMNDDENRSHGAQKELRSLLKDLQSQIDEYARRLDPLRMARTDDGDSPAQWRNRVLEIAHRYASDHKGEHTWVTTCPNVKCLHNDQPFLVLMESPHFAFDFAAGPGLIWNAEVAELVHRHYCRKDGCEHVAHVKHYGGGLTVFDAAQILRIAPIGLIAAAWEKGYDLGLQEVDLDQPDTLKPYL